jgi:hypothetical protein
MEETLKEVIEAVTKEKDAVTKEKDAVIAEKDAVIEAVTAFARDTNNADLLKLLQPKIHPLPTFTETGKE